MISLQLDLVEIKKSHNVSVALSKFCGSGKLACEKGQDGRALHGVAGQIQQACARGDQSEHQQQKEPCQGGQAGKYILWTSCGLKNYPRLLSESLNPNGRMPKASCVGRLYGAFDSYEAGAISLENGVRGLSKAKLRMNPIITVHTWWVF